MGVTDAPLAVAAKDTMTAKFTAFCSFDGDIDVAVVRFERSPGAVAAALRLLSAAEHERVRRFKSEAARGRFILARAHLRRLIAARLGTPAERIEFDCCNAGKPRLAGALAKSGLRFNVSHADDLTAYALSRNLEVGIDIERVRPMSGADGMVTQFFSLNESSAYRALDPGIRSQAFFNCWTRKEAFVKAIGCGLRCALDAFDVSLAPQEPARLLRIGELAGAACGWALHGFVPAPGFVGAVAAEQRLRRVAAMPLGARLN